MENLNSFSESSGEFGMDSLPTTLSPPPIIAANATQRFQATREGMACAYLSIMLMALVPIFYGSLKSVKHQIDTVAKCRETGEQAETMTGHDAMVFPFFASGALLAFYVLIKFFPDPVNLVLSGYFFILGVFAITRIIKPTIFNYFPTRFNSNVYALQFASMHLEPKDTHSDDEAAVDSDLSSSSDADYEEESMQEMFIDWRFRPSDVLSFLISVCLGVWYVFTKHWIANNIFGLAFALNGIELLNLNSVKIGCILLCGLFIYDIFWVFGTEVMVSVARSFDAPIKLVFPQDFLVHGIWGKNFAMLGLGDIVIPGVFIALLLRFDHSLKRGNNTYFWSCFAAYVLGLGTTIAVMSIWNHAQPALLYLVPCCILVTFFVAFLKGDIKTLLEYRDHPEEENKESELKDKNQEKNKASGSKRATRSSTKKDE